MARAVTCDCGHVVRVRSEDELVAEAQRHAREAHGMEVTRDHVLALAVPHATGPTPAATEEEVER